MPREHRHLLDHRMHLLSSEIDVHRLHDREQILRGDVARVIEIVLFEHREVLLEFFVREVRVALVAGRDVEPAGDVRLGARRPSDARGEIVHRVISASRWLLLTRRCRNRALRALSGAVRGFVSRGRRGGDVHLGGGRRLASGSAVFICTGGGLRGNFGGNFCGSLRGSLRGSFLAWRLLLGAYRIGRRSGVFCLGSVGSFGEERGAGRWRREVGRARIRRGHVDVGEGGGFVSRHRSEVVVCCCVWYCNFRLVFLLAAASAAAAGVAAVLKSCSR
mmetsp:Transcript_19510/g.42096  ORF Transcript_19510/g.42096 Transcript_19510/m.42096 type:complete len:276 (+) Transcript_19510:1670-2497(+)